jgi:Disulphide bond corrector protein DsbC/AhpC/TSA family
VLAAYAEQHGITYTLLSDVGSETLRRLGLLNQSVVEQSAYYGVELRPHHYNTPYPGYFVLDEAGTVVRRRFEQSYRVRPSAPALVRDLLGDTTSSPEVSAVSTQPSRTLEARAWVEPPAYKPYQEVLLRVELTIAPGLHIYGEPVPKGFIPLSIEVEPLPHLVVEPPDLPSPRPFRIEGLDEEFFIYEGTLEISLPLRVEKAPPPGPLQLSVRLRYAACSDVECFPPEEASLRVPLAAEDVLRP